MSTWKKVLTEADLAPNTGTAGASVANGQLGLVTGNSVFDYIEGQNYGTSSATGTVESVAGTGNVNGITLASDGDSTDPTLTLSGTLGSIANSQLSNNAVTIGSTAVALGATVGTFAGLTSVTSAAFVGALTGNASTATKISSITNSNIVQLDAAQTLTNKTIAASQVTEISALTAAEGAQLENIGSTTISADQWGYLGAATGAITNTDVNVSSANLLAGLAALDNGGNIVIGDATDTTVVIAGNLQVTGTTETVSATELKVDDITIAVASGSTTAASANNSGLEVDIDGDNAIDANPAILYQSSAATFSDFKMRKSLTAKSDAFIAGMTTAADTTALDALTPGVGTLAMVGTALYVQTA